MRPMRVQGGYIDAKTASLRWIQAELKQLADQITGSEASRLEPIQLRTAAQLAMDFRQAVAVMPVTSLKLVQKWLSLAKPQE